MVSLRLFYPGALRYIRIFYLAHNRFWPNKDTIRHIKRTVTSQITGNRTTHLRKFLNILRCMTLHQSQVFCTVIRNFYAKHPWQLSFSGLSQGWKKSKPRELEMYFLLRKINAPKASHITAGSGTYRGKDHWFLLLTLWCKPLVRCSEETCLC